MTEMQAPLLGVEIIGLNDLIVKLRKYEPEVLKALQKDMKARLKPLADQVGKQYPDYPRTNTGMHWREGTGYSDKGTKPQRVRKKKGHFPLWKGDANRRVIISSSTGKSAFARVVQMSASGMVYDSALSSKTNGFIPALDYASGSAHKGGNIRSRVLYPATKTNLPMVEKEIEYILEKINKMVNDNAGGKL